MHPKFFLPALIDPLQLVIGTYDGFGNPFQKKMNYAWRTYSFYSGNPIQILIPSEHYGYQKRLLFCK